jgi:hypothetical protein
MTKRHVHHIDGNPNNHDLANLRLVKASVGVSPNLNPVPLGKLYGRSPGSLPADFEEAMDRINSFNRRFKTRLVKVTPPPANKEHAAEVQSILETVCSVDFAPSPQGLPGMPTEADFAYAASMDSAGRALGHVGRLAANLCGYSEQVFDWTVGEGRAWLGATRSFRRDWLRGKVERALRARR